MIEFNYICNFTKQNLFLSSSLVIACMQSLINMEELHRKSFKNISFYLDTLYYNCLEFGKSSSSIQTHDADS